MNLHNRYKNMPPYHFNSKLGRLFQLAIFTIWALPLSAQIDINISIDEPSCNGYSNGNITANASGGTAPYSYLWSNLQSGSTVYGISAGNWELTVTDATGTTATSATTVSEPPLLETNIEPAGDICLGTDGDLTANTTGGTPPYSYTWSSGETTQTITDLEIGFYIVTVTDANGCKAVHGAAVNAPLSVEVIATDVVCYGWCDGAVEAIVTGGTGPYTYVWNNGSTDPIIDMLPTGTFTVTVTDANGCTATGTGVINEPPPINISIDITGQCTDNANADITATGGIGPFTYNWAHGPTTPDLTNLSEGYYYLTVTDVNGICKKDTFIVISDGVEINPIPTHIGCTSDTTGSVIVEVPNGIGPLTWHLSNGMTYDDKNITGLDPGNYTVTVVDGAGCSGIADFEIKSDVDAFDISITTTPSECGGNCTGTATITPVGGVSPFSYQWDAAAGSSTSNSVVNLCPGTYSVTVYDDNGCPVITQVEIEQSPSNFDISISSTPANCGTACNGTATVVVNSGGVSPYSYQWDAAAGGVTTSMVSDLCPGTYSVTVSDAVGCTEAVSISVDEIPSDINFEISSTPTGCGTNCTGTATVENITGGTTPYTIQWDAAANDQTTPTATGLCAGTYGVTVSDFYGCLDSMLVTVSDSPSTITLSFDIVSASCNGDCDGSATVTAMGGNAPYTYQWDANANNQTTQTAENLCAGDYEVTVTDANDCTQTGIATVTEDEPLTILVQVKNATCENSNDGCAEIIGIAPDDNPPYTIEWSTGATDSLVCGLAPGNYEVTVTDSSGCEGIVPVVVHFDSSVDAQFEWKVDTCAGDSILVTFNDISTVDPTSDIVVSWDWVFSTGDTSNMNSVQLWLTEPSVDVILIVENTSGCLDTIMETVNINLFNCTLPTQDTTVCQGDELILTLSCPTNDSTLTYSWSPANMILSGMNTPSTTINTSENGEFDIWVDISSTIGCASSDTTHVTVIDTSLAKIDLSLIGYDQSCDTLEICFTNDNDSLSFANYTWYFDYPNPDATSTDLEPCYIYSSDGTYTIALVPGSDCLDTLMFDIEVEVTPMALFAFEVGDCSDEVEVKFEDKSTPTNDIVSWLWDFGNDSTSTDQNPNIFITDSSQILNVILTVEYENDCIKSDTQEVIVRIFDPINPQDTVVACGPGMEVELNPYGDSTYIYNWTPGSELIPNATYWNPIASVDDTTTFAVNIDSSDCAVIREVTVVFSEPLNLDLMPDSISLCESMDTVLIAQTNNNLMGIQYAWFDSIPFSDTISTMASMDITVGNPNMYYVVVTDENNCSQTDSIMVGNYEIALSLPDTLDICAGEPIVYEIEGLQDDYTLVWNAFDPQNFVPTDTTTFNLVATNPQNCFYKDDLFINFVDVDALVDVVPVLDTVVLGERVPIMSTNIPGFTYSWSNGQFLDDPNVWNPVALPEDEGLITFTLDVEDPATGCRSSEESTLCVITDLCDYPMIFFPSAFTPNGDGVNDILYVEGLNIDEVFFAIYNRWGEKVFESYSQDEGWDGTFNGEPVSGDAFAYYLRVRCLQGGEYFKKGNVTVIR